MGRATVPGIELAGQALNKNAVAVMPKNQWGLVQLSDCRQLPSANPETRIHMFWGRLETACCARPSLIPVSSVVCAMSGPVSANGQFLRHPPSFLLGRDAFPNCGRGPAGLYAFAESDSFLLRDRGENGNDRILEDPAGIEVRLGETAIADAGSSQSVEMGEGFEDAFARLRARASAPLIIEHGNSRRGIHCRYSTDSSCG